MQTVYKILQNWAWTLIFSRIWIALCTVCYTQVSFLLFTGDASLRVYSVLLGMGSYLLYVLPFLYHAVKRKKRSSNPRQVWVEERLPRLYVTSAFVFVLLVASFFLYPQLVFKMILYGFVVVAVTVLYELPLIPYRKQKVALREWGFAKPFILAFVWWYMGVFLVYMGWIEGGKPSIAGNELLLAARFVFILILCVIFDIRDLNGDAARGIKTWPVLWGVKKTQQLLVILSIIGGAMFWLSAETFQVKIALSAVFVVLVIINLGNITKRPWWFYDYVIDGMMILQWVVLWVLV